MIDLTEEMEAELEASIPNLKANTGDHHKAKVLSTLYLANIIHSSSESNNEVLKGENKKKIDSDSKENDKRIKSNAELAKSNDKHSKNMFGLSLLMAFLVIVQIGVTIWSSLKSNDLIEESQQITKESEKFNKEIYGKNFLDNEWQRLYKIKNEDIPVTLQKLKDNIPVKDKNNIFYLVDSFEGIGDKYCDGFISGEDVGFFFGEDLKLICNNEQVLSFQHKRGGLSFLCKQLAPDSIFAKNTLIEEVNNCNLLK